MWDTIWSAAYRWSIGVNRWYQELAQIHSPRKKSKTVTSTAVHAEEEEDENVTQPLEEGEIRDAGSSQEKVMAELEHKSKKTSESSKKRKSDSDNSCEIDKAPKRSKDVHKAVEQRWCRVKILMIGRPKPTDIAPLLPSLGVYEQYLHSDVKVDDAQTTCVFKSSKPAEGT